MSSRNYAPGMANPPRRVPPPNQQYYAVPNPQSPRSAGPSRQPSQTQPSYSTHYQPSNSSHSYMNQRNDTAQGVATGHIGAGYGPYSYNPNAQVANYSSSRFSAAPSEVSAVTTGEKSSAPIASSNAVPPYMWDSKDPDLDDALHNPDPVRDAALDRSFTIFSARGWANVSVLVLLVAGLLTLFAGYPIIVYYRDKARSQHIGFNLGGTNGTGQVPDLPNMPTLIDKDTPRNAYTRTGTDGNTYNLIFSDEFETPGRTFYPGDDPFWEGVDLNYWPTGDVEWYDPVALKTENGKLVITMEEIRNHDLNFRSGMLQSWNKFCFTTGYIEVSISMPGTPKAPGLWPGAWTMGNLGRAGYGATTEGMWPYSYDTCDLGTYPHQQGKDGIPAEADTGGPNGGPLSFLPGQRLSACTCPGSDHPGPSVKNGRGVPEIDIIETQVDVSTFTGEVSQSFQTAPYNYQYQFNNDSSVTPIFDTTKTHFNDYKGGVYQQAISAVTTIDSNNYNDQGYATYGYEWWSDPKHRDDGYITWFSEGQKTWTMTAATIGPDETAQISARIVPEEPMYIIMNLGMSPSFQRQDYKHLTFPVKMYIDYVRVYQRSGVKEGVGCSPSHHPTADYIEQHANAYTNANWTTWEKAGYSFPRNSRYDGCT
ncbi:glycoside hydrolase family 16 protein [Cristinia sonorae]|uniref:Glycoside hydrolase family 16 protein n=1 Tax=Cristinia sonorae TaxID=1940300 RepID=A0A8K0XSZ9_9AGAR|nr:glycoside hydrolase family 16 protein [Cristinia sonorae]